MAMADTAREQTGDAHHPDTCARAWFVLRHAHDRVADCLSEVLARECRLGIREFEVLLYLRDAGPAPMRIGDLEAAVSLSQPALSRLVARLHERGLVARTKAEDDQRAVVVVLTDTGRTLLARAIPLHTACVQDHFLSQVTDEEQATLLAILARLR